MTRHRHIPSQNISPSRPFRLRRKAAACANSQEDPMSLKHIWIMIRDTFSSWLDDYAPSMGAALAYYTLFSVAPLLLIVISTAGLLFGEDAVRGEIFGQFRGLMGDQGAQAIQTLLGRDRKS